MNPEYARWYRKSERGKERIEKYRNSPKGIEARRKRNNRYAKRHSRENIERDLARNRESQKKATMSGLPWGVVEDSFLLDNAGEMGIKKIAAELGRSIKSCENRLYRLRQYEQNADVLAPAGEKTPTKKTNV
jgi:hypothetical protein